MNVLKEIGIQQWRLKPEFRRAIGPQDTKPESEEQVVETHVISNGGEAVNDTINEIAIEKNTLEESGLSLGLESESSDVAIQLSEVEEPAFSRDLSNHGWQALQGIIETNEHCPSCHASNSYLGAGNPNADWLFIIDAPTTRDIDAQALLTGRTGQLFDSILLAMGLTRSEMYLSTVFKCAPTEDLSATPQCDEIIHRQVELVKPKVVVTFGEFTAQAIIKSNDDLLVLRGSEQRCFRSNTVIIPTHGLNSMLADSSLKAAVWQDLQKGLAVYQALETSLESH